MTSSKLDTKVGRCIYAFAEVTPTVVSIDHRSQFIWNTDPLCTGHYCPCCNRRRPRNGHVDAIILARGVVLLELAAVGLNLSWNHKGTFSLGHRLKSPFNMSAAFLSRVMLELLNSYRDGITSALRTGHTIVFKPLLKNHRGITSDTLRCVASGNSLTGSAAERLRSCSRFDVQLLVRISFLAVPSFMRARFDCGAR